MFLVTGGTGFIGSNLKKFIENKNEKVIISGIKGEQISEPSEILSSEQYETMLGNVSCVFHQAADNDTQIDDKFRFFNANVVQTIDLLSKAVDKGMENFVVASSTAVYGNNHEICTEETAPNPLTHYAESKLQMEEELSTFAVENKVYVTCLRYCNVFGKGESHKGNRASMIYQINEKVSKGETIKLFKHGEQVRNWVYVRDIAHINWLAYMDQLSKQENSNANYFEIYNAANKEHCDFNALIEIFKKIYQRNVPVDYIDNPFIDSYQDYLRISIKKAEDQLAFSPEYSIENGIKELVQLLR